MSSNGCKATVRRCDFLSLCSGGEQSDMLTHQQVAQVKEGLSSPFSPLSSSLVVSSVPLLLKEQRGVD